MNWWRRLFHRHDWVIYQHNVSGLYEKQEGQGNVVAVKGMVQICRSLVCKEERFVPYDSNLRPQLRQNR